jgi:primosomal replication protein N''
LVLIGYNETPSLFFAQDMHNNKNLLAIERLTTLLNDISTRAQKTDQFNSQQQSHRLIENNNIFSQQLFNTESDLFSPYVNEVKKRLNEFRRLYLSSKGNDNKETFAKTTLIQIEQQILSLTSALQSNQTMHQAAKISFDTRKKVKLKRAKKNANQSLKKYNKAAKAVLLSSHQLYQQLTEHREFERRLIAMITEREQQRQKSRDINNNTLSQEVLALHQRLGRCRKAISSIERNIELTEKK